MIMIMIMIMIIIIIIPFDLFLVPGSVPRLVWYDAYKRTLVANRNEYVAAAGYSSGPLQYVRRHITVNKMC